MDDNLQKLSNMDIVKIDKASIYLGNIFTVDTNLQLPSKGKMGSTITWNSGNKLVIGEDGKVMRPEAGKGNISVTLAATIAKENVADTCEFIVTVLEKERSRMIIGISEVNTSTAVGVFPELPGIVITENDDGALDRRTIMIIRYLDFISH